MWHPATLGRQTVSTSMNIDSRERETAIATLNRLVEVCEDAHDLYGSASADTLSLPLRELFIWHSRQRGRFADDLRRIIRRLGGTPAARNTASGALGRRYLDVKAAMLGNDLAILLECQRAEERVKGAYETATRHPLAWEIYDPIRQHFEIVCAAYEHLRRLCDIAS